MKLITRARQVQQAVRNVGRLREIVSAMSRFGFDIAITRLKLRKYRRTEIADSAAKALPIEARLRLLMENLGPTFIKLGQILANRPDLFPADFIKEFAKLQNEVAPIPFSEIEIKIEEALGAPLAQLFHSVEKAPLGSASIAQVHKARLHSGESVVIKVRKPGVKRMLKRDLDILEFFAAMATSNIQELEHFHLPLVVSELKSAILKEADFVQEARSMQAFAKNFANNDSLAIPKVYPELSSDSVLTMEFLDGIKLSNISEVQALGIDTHVLMEKGLDCFMRSILVFGLFHADPHGGNVLVMENGKLGLIDFGSAAYLSERSKKAIINMFLALISEDYEALVLEYLLISPPHLSKRTSSQVDLIQREVEQVFGPYHGLPIKEIPAGKLLLEATSIAYRNEIILPQDLVMVFKSIVTLEGIGRKLDPDLDLLGPATRVAKDVFAQQWNPHKIGRELLSSGRDISRFLRLLPRQASEILRQIEDGDIKIHTQVSGLESLGKTQNMASQRLSLALISASLLGAATAAHISESFHLSIEATLWSLAIASFVLLLRYILFWK